jgi:transposase
MDNKKQKRYSEEFKQNVVELYKAGKSVSELSREYEVSRVSIYKWIKEREKHVTPSGEVMTTKEIMEMKKEMKRIKTENEILKKTLKILSKE